MTSATLRSRVSKALKYLGLFVYGGCVYNVITKNIVAVFKCQQKSMYPTINKTSADDHVIVEMISKHKGSLKKNDVVVLKHPNYPEQFICKRIVSVYGDLIPQGSGQGSSMTPVVPRGHVWVEGDNSPCSTDSRAFGPVPLGLVVGRVTLRIWPPSQIGWIQ